MKFYITTAIDYVNAAPHIGHAYEKILADVLARWHRLLGEDVFFLTGTDENAQKNVQAAKKVSIPIKKFIDKNTAIFIQLCEKLNISYNDFIRTTEKRHKKVVQDIFLKAYKAGDIYKGFYEGLYCGGCEAFKTEKELVDGKCPEHDKELEFLKEETYFFKLNKYKDKIIEYIRETDFILPKSREKEILSRLKESLKDLSVTRYNIECGIPCPIDKKHKIYVWFDALVNYISALQYPSTKFKKYWPADYHVIGKGINWFHSVIWPAILMSARIELPKHLFVHGYVNIKGSKISKSIGMKVDPIELAEKYGADALRYFLIREIPPSSDGDFSETALIDRHNSELADKLGNLFSRVTALAEKYGIKKCENSLLEKLNLDRVKDCMEKLETDKALGEIFLFVDSCNEYVQKKKPWETRDAEVLYELVDALKCIAILLQPFLPTTAEKIAKHLGFKIKKIEQIDELLKEIKTKKAPILFQKIK